MTTTDHGPAPLDDDQSSGRPRTRGVHALGWSTLGTAVMFGANLAALLILARLIAPEVFGAVAALTAMGMILRGIVLFAITQSMVQLAPSHDTDRSAASLAAGFALLCAVAFVAGAVPISSAFNVDDPWIVRWFALVLVFQSFSAVPMGLMQREFRFKQLTMVQVVSTVVGSFMVPVVLARSGYTYGALLAALIVQAGIECVGTNIACRRLLVPTVHPHRFGVVARMVRTMSLVMASGAVINNADNLVVSASLGSNALGLYSRAYRVMALPANLFADAADSVLTPVLMRSRTEQARLGEAFRTGTFGLALVLLSVSAVACVLSGEIVLVLLGPQWSEAVPALRVLTVGMFFRVAIKPGAAVLRAFGRLPALTGLLGVYAGLVVVLSLLGSSRGIAGVAVGVVVASIGSYLAVTVSACAQLQLPVRHVLTGVVISAGVAFLGAGSAFAARTAFSTMGAFAALVICGAIGMVPCATTCLLPSVHRRFLALVKTERPTPP